MKAQELINLSKEKIGNEIHFNGINLLYCCEEWILNQRQNTYRTNNEFELERILKVILDEITLDELKNKEK